MQGAAEQPASKSPGLHNAMASRSLTGRQERLETVGQQFTLGPGGQDNTSQQHEVGHAVSNPGHLGDLHWVLKLTGAIMVGETSV